MFCMKDYESGFDYYGLPTWMGAIFYAKLEVLIGQFNTNMFDNGLFGSGILTINSDGMSAEEIEDTVRNVKRDLVGTEKRQTQERLLSLLAMAIAQARLKSLRGNLTAATLS